MLNFMRTIDMLFLNGRVYRRGEYGEYLGVWVPMRLPAVFALNNNTIERLTKLTDRVCEIKRSS